jgi:uncharacterized protein (DUF1330 family)
VTITDPARYQGYLALAPAAFSKHGAKFLARGGEAEALEGPTYTRHVVIEFPDLATARACYASPEYQTAKAKRTGACEALVCLVGGLN